MSFSYIYKPHMCLVGDWILQRGGRVDEFSFRSRASKAKQVLLCFLFPAVRFHVFLLRRCCSLLQLLLLIYKFTVSSCRREEQTAEKRRQIIHHSQGPTDVRKHLVLWLKVRICVRPHYEGTKRKRV